MDQFNFFSSVATAIRTKLNEPKVDFVIVALYFEIIIKLIPSTVTDHQLGERCGRGKSQKVHHATLTIVTCV